MIFSTLVSGRLMCGILRRNFSTSSIMTENPGILKYIGWDFPSIHLESTHISDEIVFVSIEYTQVYTYKVVVMFYIAICIIRYLDWNFPCLHKLWYLWWNCLCLIDKYLGLYHQYNFIDLSSNVLCTYIPFEDLDDYFNMVRFLRIEMRPLR